MKKSWQKLLAVLLAMLFIIPAAVPAQAALDDRVTANLEEALKLGFAPDDELDELDADDPAFEDDITRGEYAALLCELLMAVSEQYITDTEDMDYTQDAFLDTSSVWIDDLAFLGVIDDTPNHRFYPGERIVREDAAVMLDRITQYLGIPEKPTKKAFGDNASIHKDKRASVANVVGLGLMSATDARNNFAPQDRYTIAQAMSDVYDTYLHYIALLIADELEAISGSAAGTEDLEETEPSPTPKPTPRPTAAPPRPSGASAEASETVHNLVSSGDITVTVTGDHIAVTTVKLTNRTDKKVTVTIDAGTWFESIASSVQNMLVIQDTTVTLNANETKSVDVDTACMNASRDIPDSGNSFALKSGGSTRITRLAQYFNENNVSYEVAQAAVWILTDNLSDTDVRKLLQWEDGTLVISQADVDEARAILAEVR